MNKQELENLANLHGYQILDAIEKVRLQEKLTIPEIETLIQYLTTKMTAQQCINYHNKIIEEKLNE